MTSDEDPTHKQFDFKGIPPFNIVNVLLSVALVFT